MGKKSAGILMYKRTDEGIKVLLVHPGGPFWSRRDLGAWSMPKGEYLDEEGSESAARREFSEEVGTTVDEPLHLLGQIRQRSGKIVIAYAAEGDLDASSFRSETFEMEWPRHSGRLQSFAEVDRAQWFTLPIARHKILPGLRPFLGLLESRIISLDPRNLHGQEGQL
ncbi:NUDIX domain-containing protein [Phyllobacterium trifolii]|uniref:NUDIX domain-containing protein n=1 Tax=Phyllobacterium trifolii TaxID=300193 RepID=UPI0016207B62|nr:NUDIX domain-containing protein [Phyllobacterium trifolii]